MDPTPLSLIDALAANAAIGNGILEPAFAELPEVTQNRYREIAREKLRVLAAPEMRADLKRWVSELG